MESIRKIVREELERFHVMHETSEEPNPFENHPFFGNSEKVYNYAIEWMEKAQKMERFHQLVGNLLWDTAAPEERIKQLRSLYKEYV